jgi:membrane associated rhomboid family serine protease
MIIGNNRGFSFLPPIVKNLIIINILMFAGSNLIPHATEYLALYHWDSPLFKPWQIVTHIFMHANFSHLFFNMFSLWMFGTVVENRLGSQRFLIFYLICGFGAALLHLLVFSWENQAALHTFKLLSEAEQINAINYIFDIQSGIGDGRIPVAMYQAVEAAVPMITPMVGASGAIYGVLFAFGYLFPNNRIMIYFLFPIKAKYLVAILAIIELFSGMKGMPGDNIAHFAHLGGMLFAYILFKYWRIEVGGFKRWN